MRALAVHVPSERDDLLDTAGTGGGRRSFNVSTTAALIAAGAGCAVAKHGNRSATSCRARPTCSRRSARASTSSPEAVARCIDEAGFGFMFAPAHHQATRYVVPVRRELAVRTIFNLLGPLTNPAGARRQLIGVSDARFLETMAGALARLGVDRALVVAGEDGLDEISASAPTRVVEVNGDGARAPTRVDAAGARRRRRERPAATCRRHARSRTPQRDARGASPASTAPRASWRWPTPAPRSTRPAAPTRSPRASSARARGDRRRARGGRARALRRRRPRQRAGMSVLDEILERTRADVAPPARAARAAAGGSRRRRPPRAPRERRFRDALRRAGRRR